MSRRAVIAAIGGLFESLLRRLDPRIKITGFVIGAVAPITTLILDAGKPLQTAAALAVVAVSVGCWFEIARIGREAGRDFLTGLLNRRSLHSALIGLLRESQKPEKQETVELCIALIDLDHFKELNDTLGHKAGDKALKIVAELLRRLFRGSDIAARFGGDEFVLVLPRTSVLDAERKLESFRRHIASDDRLSFKDKQFVPCHVTVSVGVTFFTCDEVGTAITREAPGDEHDIVEGMLQQADKLLYEAKASGRNRVVARESPDKK